jgi:hypothetical protein
MPRSKPLASRRRHFDRLTGAGRGVGGQGNGQGALPVAPGRGGRASLADGAHEVPDHHPIGDVSPGQRAHLAAGATGSSFAREPVVFEEHGSQQIVTHDVPQPSAAMLGGIC